MVLFYNYILDIQGHIQVHIHLYGLVLHHIFRHLVAYTESHSSTGGYICHCQMTACILIGSHSSTFWSFDYILGLSCHGPFSYICSIQSVYEGFQFFDNISHFTVKYFQIWNLGNMFLFQSVFQSFIFLGRVKVFPKLYNFQFGNCIIFSHSVF